MRLCQACNTEPVVGPKSGAAPHKNARYCALCRSALLSNPRSSVTAAQAEQIRTLIGTVARDKIAERVGISKAQVNRWLRENGLRSDSITYPQEVVEAVLHEYYAAPSRQGKARVQERFDGVNVRSIVERYGKQVTPRQERWTSEQLHEAAKMAGLVSRLAQARYFGRPNAYDGSIKSLWEKRFGVSPTDLNGLGVHRTSELAVSGCPAVVVQRQDNGQPIAKVLWIDLVAYLRPDVPAWVGEAVRALAKFQVWLHGTETTDSIRAMITERETTYGNKYGGNAEWEQQRTEI